MAKKESKNAENEAPAVYTDSGDDSDDEFQNVVAKAAAEVAVVEEAPAKGKKGAKKASEKKTERKPRAKKAVPKDESELAVEAPGTGMTKKIAETSAKTAKKSKKEVVVEPPPVVKVDSSSSDSSTDSESSSDSDSSESSDTIINAPLRPPEEDEEEDEEENKEDEQEETECVESNRPETPQGFERGQGNEIYCGGLPYDVTEDQLKELFEADCGQITRINLIQRKGVAFITFNNVESANKAVEFNDTPYMGRTLKINITGDRKKGLKSNDSRSGKHNFNASGVPPPSNEICIRNLSFQSTEEGMRELFSECGVVTRCYIPKFKDSGKSMGRCFISFTTVDAATRAVEYNNTDIDGRTVNIQYAIPRGANPKHRNNIRGRSASGRRGGGMVRGKGDHDNKWQKRDAPEQLGSEEVKKPKSIIFDDDD